MSTLGVGGAPGMYTGIYTDFRSEAPDLLGAVMQKRNMDLQERQVKVNEDAQILNRDRFTDTTERMDAQNKYYQGLAKEKANIKRAEESEAMRNRFRNEYIANKMDPSGLGRFNIFQPTTMWDLWMNQSGRKADLGREFDELSPEQTYEPESNLIFPNNPNVTINPNDVGQYMNTPQTDKDNLFSLTLDQSADPNMIKALMNFMENWEKEKKE